jgi:DNA mismatch repair protein MutS2
MEMETLQRLEYDKIKLRLSDFAASYLGQRHIERMQPLTDLKVIAALISEVEEGEALIQHGQITDQASVELGKVRKEDYYYRGTD